ncbi:MAG: class I SAM-dependent methyltransferase, partial [Candidatus Woesearchaeota archaeon]
NIVDGGNPCDMIVNSVVTKDNIYNLDEQVRLLSKMGVQNIKFSFPELKGKMIENKDLYPNPDAASEKISAALDICEEEGKNGLYDGLPFCYLPEKHQSKLDNLDTNDIYYMSEFFEKGFFRTDMGEREKHFECLRCSFHDICPGFQLQSHFNARPIIKKVPEKIVFSRKYEKKENPRSITLKNNGESTYRYEERYFRSYDIDRIKDKGNVLLYRPSGKNFLENLEILEHNKTDGRFTPTGISFYDKAKKAIERELYGLNGRILDVGFGGLIFYDIFRKIKMSGDVSYVGIDPDKENVKYAKERFPGEDFRMCGIEDLDKEPEYHNHFDAIVMIGCYNHFEQLEQAIKAAEHMIDEEGKIIIFENNLMAILDEEDTYNEKEQKNEVTSKAKLEHYRNHDIEEASRFIEGLGLKIEKKDDYGIFWTIVVRGKR